jgi:hypothetical protein
MVRVAETVISQLDVKEYAQQMGRVRSTLELAGSMLEGLANGMILAQEECDRNNAANPSLAETLAELRKKVRAGFDAQARLIADIQAHFTPVPFSDGSGMDYPAMTEELWVRIRDFDVLKAIDDAKDALASPDNPCPNCEANREASRAPEQEAYQDTLREGQTQKSAAWAAVSDSGVVAV